MARRLFFALAVLMIAAYVRADSISWVNDGGDGWDNGDSVGAADMDEIKTSVDDNASDIAALQAGTGITALDIDVVTGDTSDDDDLDVAAGGTGVSTLTDGGVLLGNGTGDIVATAVMTEGQLLIGDGTTDPAVATVSGDVAIASTGTATIQANSVALSTDTTGNYVATIADSGASEVTVSGSGSEGAAVTLAIASTITRDSELRAFTVSASAASGSCTAGDLWLKTSATVTLYACTATDTWSTGVGI